MKILFILPQSPDPPDSGGKIVLHHLVNYFREKHKVTLVCFFHHPRELEALKKTENLYEKVYAFPARTRKSLSVILGTLLSGKPYKAHRFWSQDLDMAVRRILIQEEFDLIHVQNFYMGQFITGNERALKVLYKENMEREIFRRFAETRKGWLFKKLAEMETKRLELFERRMCRKFDKVLMISPKDLERLHEVEPQLELVHQPPCLDLNEYKINQSPKENKLLFTGSLSYYPNQDGLKWFFDEVYPLFDNDLPGLQLVGKDPPAWLKNFSNNSNVEIIGWVKDIQPYFEKALGYFVPLRIGGGVRLKILEAWAMGVPVVSTSVGCEGLPVENGKNILIGDTPEEFKEKVKLLLEDAQLRTTLIGEARKSMEIHFNAEKVLPDLENKYQSWLK